MNKPKENSYVIACSRREDSDQLRWSILAFYTQGGFRVHVDQYSYEDLDGVTHWYYLNKKQEAQND